MSSNSQPILYSRAETNRDGYLNVDDIHSIYWDEAGNPDGMAVLILHGGPGAGSSPLYRGFFDPTFWRIISFDQRGCGRSTPAGETRANTTAHLVADIESLRAFLHVEKWLVFGGSWGATLGLAYAQTHPNNVIGIVLRSVFLGSAEEVNWFFQGGKYYHPEAWLRLLAQLTPPERGRPLEAYHARLFCGDPDKELAAARAWCQYEGARISLLPGPFIVPDTLCLTMAKLESHYFKHLAFLQPDQLVRGMAALRQIPVAIVHGRYDMLCPPINSFRLIESNPNVRLSLIPDAGHSAFEPPMAAALLSLVQQFRQEGNFLA